MDDLPILCRVTVPIARPQPITLQAFHGESFRFCATLTDRGHPLDPRPGATARLYWKTPQMPDTQWYAKAAVYDPVTATLSADWTAADDTGDDRLTFFLALESPDGTHKAFRIFGTLSLAASPGFNPATLTPEDARRDVIDLILGEAKADTDPLRAELRAAEDRLRQAQTDLEHTTKNLLAATLIHLYGRDTAVIRAGKQPLGFDITARGDKLQSVTAHGPNNSQGALALVNWDPDGSASVGGNDESGRFKGMKLLCYGGGLQVVNFCAGIYDNDKGISLTREGTEWLSREIPGTIRPIVLLAPGEFHEIYPHYYSHDLFRSLLIEGNTSDRGSDDASVFIGKYAFAGVHGNSVSIRRSPGASPYDFRILIAGIDDYAFAGATLSDGFTMEAYTPGSKGLGIGAFSQTTGLTPYQLRHLLDTAIKDTSVITVFSACFYCATVITHGDAPQDFRLDLRKVSHVAAQAFQNVTLYTAANGSTPKRFDWDLLLGEHTAINGDYAFAGCSATSLSFRKDDNIIRGRQVFALPYCRDIWLVGGHPTMPPDAMNGLGSAAEVTTVKLHWENWRFSDLATTYSGFPWGLPLDKTICLCADGRRKIDGTLLY